jgi:hypothetical protein
VTQQAYSGDANPRGKHKMRNRVLAIPPEGGSLSNHGRSEPDYKIEDCGFETPCWLWLKYRTPRGYGLSRYWDVGEGWAHRAYYVIAGGTIPAGYDLHHKCENPPCVNPDHMEPIPKGHHVREHKRETVALSDEQRAEIRELGLNPDLTQQNIADLFGIPRPTVNKILNGYSWFDGERVYPDVDCRGCGAKFTLTDRRQRYCSTCKSRRRAR